MAPGLVEARVGFLELKKWGDRPTPLQEHELRTLKKAGATVAWADNLDDAWAFVETLLS